jgi:hypothetical protein
VSDDEEALGDLVAGAGFEAVLVQPRAGMVRFGSIQELVLAQGTRSPLAAPITADGPSARAALLADAETALAPWKSPAEVSFPIEALLLSGRIP